MQGPGRNAAWASEGLSFDKATRVIDERVSKPPYPSLSSTYDVSKLLHVLRQHGNGVEATMVRAASMKLVAMADATRGCS